MKSSKAIIDTISDKMKATYEKTFSEFDDSIAEIIALTHSFSNIGINIENSELIDEIVSDIFTAIYSNLNGLYRHCYISLRCAIEFSISILQFNDNNYAYLRWKLNKKDISWNSLTNGEYAVLTKEYIDLHRSTKSNKYELLFDEIKEYYRTCSEFVHGKLSYIYNFSNDRVEYNEEYSKECFKVIKGVLESIISIYALRFGNNTEYDSYELIEDCLKKYGENSG